MNNQTFGIIALILADLLMAFVAYRLGEVRGRLQMLGIIRKELDKTEKPKRGRPKGSKNKKK